jgi:recombination protein RecA
MFNEGISRIGSIVDLGTELNVLRKSGAFYSFGDQRLGQGRENVKEFLKGRPELTDEIEGLIRQTMAEKGAATIAIAATSAAKNGAKPADDEEDDEAEF